MSFYSQNLLLHLFFILMLIFIWMDLVQFLLRLHCHELVCEISEQSLSFLTLLTQDETEVCEKRECQVPFAVLTQDQVQGHETHQK